MARAALMAGDTSREGSQAWPVRSPVRGRVLRMLQESETPVSLGAPLLEIGDPTDIEVVADLLTTDAVRIHPGNRVQIEAWGGDQPRPAGSPGRTGRPSPRSPRLASTSSAPTW